MTQFEEMHRQYVKALDILHEASTYTLGKADKVDKKALKFSQALAVHTAELVGSMNETLATLLDSSEENQSK